MSAVPSALPTRVPRRAGDRIGDVLFRVVTFVPALAAVALVVAIGWKIADGSRLAYGKFGLGFVAHAAWDPVKGVFGARDFILGTALTSVLALLLATPIAVAVGLYLSELAPRGVRDVIGSLVEMLAAIPSVVVGLWGILVLGPFLADRLDPVLQHLLGWTPFFSGDIPSAGTGVLTAAVVLTIMVVPIVASISRDLFQSVPRELEEGALALGMTRWEMVRGVVLPSARPGIAAAVILGLGRAVGEAIAVTQVIGGFAGFDLSLFKPGDTLASRVASQYQGATSDLQLSALVYLAAILLAISLVVNLLAQTIVRRFEFVRTGGD
jgi:phosphate transport system permease protein